METLMQDLRYGVRVLRRAPSFTLVAILTLALGIAANTLVFSIVNAVLLRHLPYPDPGRLVMVWGSVPQVSRTPISAPNFLDYRERSSAFQAMAAFTSADGILNDAADPLRVRTGRATPDLFRVLGVGPALGRGFSQDEGQPGHGGVVVLSYGLWQRRFAARPQVIGTKILLNSKPYTVIGVMPAAFEFTIPGYFRAVDLWAPVALSRGDSRSTNFLRVIARLKPGASLERGGQDLARITAELAREYPEVDRSVGAKVVSLREQMVGETKPALLILLGAVAFVLLIACANVASLQFERASLRQREVGIRRALGASGGQLLRQLLTESMMLGLAGGLLGVLLAAAGMTLLKGRFTGNLPLTVAQLIDLPVLAFTLGIALATGVLTGLAPTFQVFSSSLVQALREGGRSSTGGVGSGRLRDALIVLEFSFSLVLLTGAGVLIDSFVNLLRVPPGFDAHNVLVAAVQLPGYAYKDAAGQVAFFRQAVDRLGGLPGVAAAGGIDDLPLTSDRDADGFQIEGQPAATASELPVAQVRAASPGYFRAMGIPLMKGRIFADTDREAAPEVAVINRTMAHRFFPHVDPVGKRLRLGEGAPGWLTIVGVVGDVRDLGLEAAPDPEVYRPFAQAPAPYMSLVARTATAPAGSIQAAREAIRSVDRGMPAVAPTTMEQIVSLAMADRRFNVLLISIFAAIALILAAVGMYGVISYWATQRTHEIGIRIALGARRADVSRLVMGRGAALALLSIVFGVALSLALAHLITSLVFGASAANPAVLAGVGVLLAAVAMLACWIPARRATAVDPMVALRRE